MKITVLLTKIVLAVAAASLMALQVAGQATAIPASRQITPEDLVKLLQSSPEQKPLMIQVGSHVLYTQTHIPGSEYLGPASTTSQARCHAAPHAIHRSLLRMLPMGPLSQCKTCC